MSYQTIRSWRILLRSCLMLGLASSANPAAAQTAADTTSTPFASEGSLGEVVVTARKRTETESTTPVDVTVVTSEQLKFLKIENLSDLASIEPDLKVQEAFGPQGALVFLRGIGSGIGPTYTDQSVGFVIDGVSMSQGNFYRAGAFDLAQLEVLKGPQGLFFGKSTTAGIISLDTADPTTSWQSEVNTGYEFTAAEKNFNAFISGPINDNLGFRFAGFYDQMDGWLFSPNPDPAVNKRMDDETFGARLTLKYDDGPLRARFKVTGYHDFTRAAPQLTSQFTNCSLGHPQDSFYPYDNCTLDKYTSGAGNIPPYNAGVNWATAPNFAYSPFPIAGNGQPFQRTETLNGMLQVDYDLTHDLTLSSVTGYSWVDVLDTGLGAIASFAVPYYIGSGFREGDVSEEVRLSSNWHPSWVNFMVDGYYSEQKSDNLETAEISAFESFGQEDLRQTGRTYAGFAQLVFTPIERLELSVGARYTHVNKFFTFASVYTNNPENAGFQNVNRIGAIPSNQSGIKDDNTSPEFTINYHPTGDFTVFGSYKRGYKAPGFNANTFLAPNVGPGMMSPFGGEKVSGFEGGVKGFLLDRHLYFTVTGFDYLFTHLQVGFFDQDTGSIIVNNGADARTRGAEFSLTYQPDLIRGLKLNGSVNYDRATYSSYYQAPCYGGEIAPQCVAAATSTYQNLTGQRLYEAPMWTGSFGFTYTAPINDSLSWGITQTTEYSSGYLTAAGNLPTSWQGSWATVDGALRFGKLDGPWEVALIGRNLANRYYTELGYDPGTVVPGKPADNFAFVNRSRQVLLQVTVRPKF